MCVCVCFCVCVLGCSGVFRVKKYFGRSKFDRVTKEEKKPQKWPKFNLAQNRTSLKLPASPMGRPRSSKVGSRFRDPFLDSTDKEPGLEIPKPQTGFAGKSGEGEALSRIERKFRDVQLFPTIYDAQRSLLRSQSGPGAGLLHVPHPPLSSSPSATPSDEAHLPVWPPYRFLWPPPRSLGHARIWPNRIWPKPNLASLFS